MGVELAIDKARVAEKEDVNFSDSELVYHVRDALRLVPLGDTDNYSQLIGVMHYTGRLTPDEVALLVTSLRALSGAVSYIDIVHHWSLLSSIFGMSMWDYGPDVMDALVELIILLAASSGKYVDSCLRMLLIVLYVENILRLEGGPLGEIIGSMMLFAVVDRLIDLDVEIGWDEILQDDFSKGIFEMELEDVEETADDIEKDSDELPIECMSRKNFVGNIVAEKLDSLMVLTLEHLDSCNEGGRLIRVFETLLQSFQKTVLTAYKSKFAQFVMFYSCSLDPENCGVRFAKTRSDIFMDGQSPLHRLVNWCFNYCQIHDGDINPEANRVFYSGCQAIMYALCFRMRSMIGVPHLKSRLLLMPIETILKHPLNPLKMMGRRIFLQLSSTGVPAVHSREISLSGKSSSSFNCVRDLCLQ